VTLFPYKTLFRSSASFGDDEIVFGTLDINPIRLIVSRGKERKRIFNQQLPGPIELRKEKEEFKLVSPSVGDVDLAPLLKPMLASLPISAVKDPHRSCTRGSSKPLEVMRFLESLNGLRSNIFKLIPLP
jgi:hypothetical protein